jgi:hypothetical protein
VSKKLMCIDLDKVRDFMSYCSDIEVLKYGMKFALNKKDYRKIEQNINDIKNICKFILDIRFDEI